MYFSVLSKWFHILLFLFICFNQRFDTSKSRKWIYYLEILLTCRNAIPRGACVKNPISSRDHFSASEMRKKKTPKKNPETRSLRSERIEATEISFYRRMLRIQRTLNLSNIDVLEKMETKSCFILRIRKKNDISIIHNAERWSWDILKARGRNKSRE